MVIITNLGNGMSSQTVNTTSVVFLVLVTHFDF